MALRLAVVCGMAAAIAVPAILASQSDDAEAGTVLLGQLIHLPVGGGMELHWSWSIFCVVTLVVWGLLAAARTT